jgi:hypothetical protein
MPRETSFIEKLLPLTSEAAVPCGGPRRFLVLQF